MSDPAPAGRTPRETEDLRLMLEMGRQMRRSETEFEFFATLQQFLTVIVCTYAAMRGITIDTAIDELREGIAGKAKDFKFAARVAEEAMKQGPNPRPN